jgi:GNAT superfamily N-acetyltransferase
MAIEVRKAEPGNAMELTAIAFAAKRHWGYPEAWIQRWRETLTITPDYIANNATFAATDGDAILGFSALRKEAAALWIDHLWVLPAAMGRGIGRRLYERCEQEARTAGMIALEIEADPNAEAFYARMGARTVERVPAPMDGVERFLPIMEKVLR